MAQGMDAAAAGAKPDADMALNKMQLEALGSIFKDIDKDGSGGLNQDELRSVGAGDYSADAKNAASILIDHFDDAQNFVSLMTQNDFGKDAAHSAFKKLFIQDDNASGVSMTDLQSMAFVTSSEDVAKLLNDMRGQELFSGTLYGIGAAFQFSGAAFSMEIPIASALFAVGGGINTYLASDLFFNSDVPKFSDYMNKRRNMISTWTK